MTNPPKKKGTAAESSLTQWLATHGHPTAARLTLAGSKDRGDIGGIHHHENGVAHPVVVEVKNRRDLAAAIRDGLAELDAEMLNAGTTFGVLVVKPHGVGLDRPEDWYAIRRVAEDPVLGGATP